MSSKKFTLLVTLLLGFSAINYGQLGGILDYSDSSKVSSKNMAQFNEWRNNTKTSLFSAKPRDMWQLGIYGGMLMVDGDAPAGRRATTIFPGYNVGLSLRKSLGYTVSLRGSIAYGQTYGLDYRDNANLANAPILEQTYYPNPKFYIHNYKSEMITPSLDVLVSLNNIMFHKKENKVNVYALVGYSPLFYKTTLDALNGSSAYDFATLRSSQNGAFLSRSRKDIRSDLQDFFDFEYESPASLDDRTQNLNKSGLGKYNFRHSLNTGIGAEWKLGKRTSLTSEFKYTMTFDDYVDGWAFANNNQDDAGDRSNPKLSPDKDNVITANIGFNVNLGNSSKRVSPLWWHNPLGYPYHEMRNPIIPKPILDDSDNDGVTDQFDIEPNTPAGCPVDTKGKSRDTDGDGVPDCRDKELITPTACQPVDADGVGKCPDPACCTDVKPPLGCTIGALPSVTFSGNAVTVSGSAQSILDAAAAQIKANPACKICVVGHGGASKREQQLSWDRTNAVINYLVEQQGISRDRFVFKFGENGDKNTVDLQDCSGEDGPNMVPAPHPQYRRN